MLKNWNKEIFLLGDKWAKDNFEYLFKGLNINSEGINLNRFDRNDQLLVLCENTEKIPCENAEQMFEGNKMKYGKDYLYMQDFFQYYNPIYVERKERKLAVWGTGDYGGKLWDIFTERGISSEIDFFIDNNTDKKSFKGKDVVQPSDIRERKDVYIIVATRKCQWEIYHQLEEYGFKAQKDFVCFEEACKEYKEMLRKVCFTITRYSHVCRRPFGYCNATGNGLYLCCPDYMPVSAGDMNTETFEECWNSYTARILRLSVQNGTFAFCNKQYCVLFDFKEKLASKPYHKNKYRKEHLKYPDTLVVSIDSSCNLSCPSCREKVIIKKGEERKEIERMAEDLLENAIPYTKRLWMAGNGEVFFSPIYKNMLQDDRCRQGSNIGVLSNGTLFNEENWELLDGMNRSIEVIISMDGVKDETIEKLRRGSKASELKQNLKFLGELRKKQRISKLALNCVLQPDNVSEIHELLEYCGKIGVDKVYFLKLQKHQVHSEEEFNKLSIVDENGKLKKEYKQYFTPSVLSHPLADWWNHAETFKMKKRKELYEYDMI